MKAKEVIEILKHKPEWDIWIQGNQRIYKALNVRLVEGDTMIIISADYKDFYNVEKQ